MYVAKTQTRNRTNIVLDANKSKLHKAQLLTRESLGVNIQVLMRLEVFYVKMCAEGVRMCAEGVPCVRSGRAGWSHARVKSQ